MKELTIEEKAKAYDDVIERAKRMFSEKELNYLFPELAESEDERMRKAIIKALRSHSNSVNSLSSDGFKMEDAIAWLEKQGETFTKKDVDDAYLKGVCDAKNELEKQGESKLVSKMQVSEELYEHIRITCACIDDALSSKTLADIKDYLIMADHSAKSAFDMVEKQGEQKPAAWSEEEKESLELLINYISSLADVMPYNITIPSNNNRKRMLNFLNSLKDGVVP